MHMVSGCLRSGAFWLMVLLLAGCGEQPMESIPQEDDITAEKNALYHIEGRIELTGGLDPTGAVVFVAGTSYAGYADSAGHYVIRDLPPGDYTLFAQHQDYQQARVANLSLDPDATEAEHRVSLSTVQLWPREPRPVAGSSSREPESGILSGRVNLEGRESEGGVLVEVEDTSLATLTNRGGNFALSGMEPGVYTLIFSYEGYETAQLEASVEAGLVTRLEDVITLSPLPEDALASSLSILGQLLVLGMSGEMIEEIPPVSVGIVENEATARVQADRSFEFHNLTPGSYTLVATAPGYRLAEPVVVTVTEDAPSLTVLTMRDERSREESGDLTGMVELAAAGSSRRATNPAGTLVALTGANRTGAADSSGSFALAEIEPGIYTLVLSKPGYLAREIPNIEIRGGETTDVGVIELEPDVERPRLLASIPEDGRRDWIVRPENVIRLVFNKPMRLDTLGPALNMQPPCNFKVRRVAVEGAATPEAGDVIEMVFTNGVNRRGLELDTRYRLTLSENATDHDGLGLEEDSTIQFSTAGLSVIQTVPPNGAGGVVVDPRRPVMIYFNAAVDRETLVERNVDISPDPIAMPANWGMEPDSATGWTRLYLPMTTHPDRRYTITLRSRIKTIDGDRLDGASYRFNFQTAETP